MKESKFQQYFHCFVVCILVLYVFWFSYQQNIVIIPISTTFRGAVPIRGGAYFIADTQRYDAYQRAALIRGNTVLPNISRSKGNQTIKFGQLIECNMRNIFLEKSYKKCGGESSARPFSNNLKLIISLDQQPKVLNSLFLLYAKLRAIEIY